MSTKFRDNLLTFIFLLIFLLSICINAPCIMYYPMGISICCLTAICTGPKAELKNLSNLKSIKFFIVCMHTEYLFAASSVVSVNYIILFISFYRLVVYIVTCTVYTGHLHVVLYVSILQMPRKSLIALNTCIQLIYYLEKE